MGPLPVCMRAEQLQGEDVLPGNGVQVLSLSRVFLEGHLSCSSDGRQRAGHQLIHVTRRTLGTQTWHEVQTDVTPSFTIHKQEMAFSVTEY